MQRSIALEPVPASPDNPKPKGLLAKCKKLLYGLFVIPLVLILFSLSVSQNESFSNWEEARLKYDLPDALSTFPVVGAVEVEEVVVDRDSDDHKFYRLFGRCASKEKIGAWFQKNCGKGKSFIGHGGITDSDQMQITLYSLSCEMEIIVNEVSKSKARFMLEYRPGECAEEIKAIFDKVNESTVGQGLP